MRFEALIVLLVGLFAGSLFAQPGLAGLEWKLTYLRGISPIATRAFIKVDTAGVRFTGNTGCNIMNGDVKVAGSRIAFNTIITSKLACAITTAPTESALLNSLGRVDRYQKYRDHIRLYAGKQLLIELSPRYITPEDPEPQSVGDSLTLEDKKWVLESIGNKVIPKVKEEAFIVFDPEKRSAGGNSTCNAFGGSYEAEGNKLKITDTISTMRACIEDERMNIERDFFDALSNVDRYEIKVDKLYLYQGNKLLLTFSGRKKI